MRLICRGDNSTSATAGSRITLLPSITGKREALLSRGTYRARAPPTTRPVSSRTALKRGSYPEGIGLSSEIDQSIRARIHYSCCPHCRSQGGRGRPVGRSDGLGVSHPKPVRRPEVRHGTVPH